MIKRMLVWAVILSMMLVPSNYVTAMESESEIKEIELENESVETTDMVETVGENDNLEIHETMEETETIEIPAVEIEEKYESDEKTGVEGFVYRLYKVVLDREPDPMGYEDWVNKLVNKEITGAKAAEGFVLSIEFQNRKLSNEERVEILYQTFLDRGSDPAGKKDWVSKLNNGLSLTYVYRGFANSAEFRKICDSYGIIAGNVVLKEPRDLNEGVTMFVYRCYQTFLGRTADVAGLNDWCNRLLTGEINAKEVAYGFVMSPEFQNKDMDHIEYVETLYEGLFGRHADEAGLIDWVTKLYTYYSREVVFYGFADSVEFRNLAASYGLDGSWKPTSTMNIDGGLAVWGDFIISEGYKAFVSGEPANEEQYTIADINEDGIHEMLIRRGYEDGASFYDVWVFYLKNDQVYARPSVHVDGQISYSTKYDAIISWKKTLLIGYDYRSSVFYGFNGKEYKYKFTVNQTGGNAGMYTDGKTWKNLTKEGIDSYYQGEIFFEWYDL